MTLPGLLLRLFVDQKPVHLADKVASRSRVAVWDRISHRIHALSGAEARGYIRSRAAAVIEQETDLLIAEEGPKVVRHRDHILKEAGETVIRLVQEHAQTSRRNTLPKRRAA